MSTDTPTGPASAHAPGGGEAGHGGTPAPVARVVPVEPDLRRPAAVTGSGASAAPRA